MRIAVVGTGYVGLVVGACLADNGNAVVCVDKDEEKVSALRAGHIPIYEPGLEELVSRNVAEERLSFTSDVAAAVRRSDIIFIAVGTPPRVREVVSGSTTHPFAVVSNPEFLKEGAALEDFLKPDRVVIGTDDPRIEAMMRELYEPFVRTGHPVLVMDHASAELTKYAANAMLAARISFMNEVANLCDRLGADVRQVRLGVGTDARVGASFLFPGIGYGGSCFPKDVKALIRMGGAA